MLFKPQETTDRSVSTTKNSARATKDPFTVVRASTLEYGIEADAPAHKLARLGVGSETYRRFTSIRAIPSQCGDVSHGAESASWLPVIRQSQGGGPQ